MNEFRVFAKKKIILVVFQTPTRLFLLFNHPFLSFPVLGKFPILKREFLNRSLQFAQKLRKEMFF